VNNTEWYLSNQSQGLSENGKLKVNTECMFYHLDITNWECGHIRITVTKKKTKLLL